MIANKKLRWIASLGALLVAVSTSFFPQDASAVASEKDSGTPGRSAGGIQVNPNHGLDRIDQRQFPLSRSYGWHTAAENVHAYVLDSGIEVTHADFGGRAARGIDLVGGDIANDCAFFSATGVAGQIGGTKYGAAKGVRMVSVRVRDCKWQTTPSRVVAGINWVTANAVRPAVAVLPFDLPANNEVDNAIRESIKSGVTWVVSAGSSPREFEDTCAETSPARVSEAITSTGSDVLRSGDFLQVEARIGSCVDLASPEHDPTAIGPGSDENPWGVHDGGSGLAAGAVALILAEHPTWTPQQVHQELVGKATPAKFRGANSSIKPDRVLFTGTK